MSNFVLSDSRDDVVDSWYHTSCSNITEAERRKDRK